MFLLAGEPGIGKMRLAEHVATQVVYLVFFVARNAAESALLQAVSIAGGERTSEDDIHRVVLERSDLKASPNRAATAREPLRAVRSKRRTGPRSASPNATSSLRSPKHQRGHVRPRRSAHAVNHEGMAPICLRSVSSSELPQRSTILPSLNLEICKPRTLTFLPDGGIPMNGPLWVPVRV